MLELNSGKLKIKFNNFKNPSNSKFKIYSNNFKQPKKNCRNFKLKRISKLLFIRLKSNFGALKKQSEVCEGQGVLETNLLDLNLIFRGQHLMI